MGKTFSLLPGLVLALAACGGSPDAPLAVTTALQQAGTPWVSASDIGGRTAATIQAAAAVWGAPGLGTDGVLVSYTDSIIDCDGVRATGCATGAAGQGWLLQILVRGAPCVEATTLPHEIGHLVLGGDSGHRDARWGDPEFWGAMAAALAGSAPADDGACHDFLGRQGAVFAVGRH